MNSPTDPVAQIPQPPAVPSSPHGFASIFVGPNGIRAGWRFGIFVALVAVLQIIAGVVLYLLQPQRVQGMTSVRVMTPSLTFVSEIISIASVLLAAAIMSAIEKRSFWSYGMPLKGAFGKLFWQGVLFGLVLESIEMLLISGFGGFSFGGLALAGTTLVKYAVVWALCFVLVGINEEFTFRGYAQFTLTTGMGFWPSAVLLSTLFGAVHLMNPGEGWVGALSVFMFGVFMSFTLKRTGSLWFAIGFHAAVDYAETFIYSVPDSGYPASGHLLNSNLHGPRWLAGGTIGPEGSVFVFIVLGLAFPVIAWLYPEKQETSSKLSDRIPLDAKI